MAPFEDFENQTQQLDRWTPTWPCKFGALLTYSCSRGSREQKLRRVLCRTARADRVFAREHPLARALEQVRLVAARLPDEAIVRYNHKNNQHTRCSRTHAYRAAVTTETANGCVRCISPCNMGHYVPPLLRKHGAWRCQRGNACTLRDRARLRGQNL